jgi:hypothetical protein
MCLLALFHRVVFDAPVVIGANREELYSRPGDPPRLHADRCRFVAGLDPAAGGTWLGVNEHGVLVAVTNRRKSSPPTDPRSRGLLTRDLLGLASAKEAVGLVTQELATNHYAGSNFLCADGERAVVIHAGDWLRVAPLPPGLHVLTNGDVNDDNDPRLGYAHWWLSQRFYTSASGCAEALRALCAQSGGQTPAICLRGVDKGTVSSSIISVPLDLRLGAYWHAQGPPDTTGYEDYSHLVGRLVGPRGLEDSPAGLSGS